MDGCPLGLGLVVEDKPTEFSCDDLTCSIVLNRYVSNISCIKSSSM